MSKALELQKLSNRLNLNGCEGELEGKNFFQENHSQNIWISCEIAHYEKSSISIYRRYLLVLTIFSFRGED